MKEILSKIDIEDTLFALSLNYPSTLTVRDIVGSFPKELVLANLIISLPRDVRGYLLEVCWTIAAGHLKIEPTKVSGILSSSGNNILFTWGAMLLKAARNASNANLSTILLSEANRLKELAQTIGFRLEHQSDDSMAVILKGYDEDYLEFGIYTIKADIQNAQHHAVS